MDLQQVLIVGIIFAALYKIIEVFAHRKERLNLIDRVDFSKDNKANIEGIIGDGSAHRNWATRWGCLLVGVGVGVLIAYLIISLCGLYVRPENVEGYSHYYVNEQISIIYLAGVMLFGGAGLLVSHYIEKKQAKKD